MYLGALVCLVLSAFFSGSEIALFSSDEIKLKSLYRNHRGLNGVLSLRDHPEATLSTILLGNTLVNIMFASLITSIVHSVAKVSHGMTGTISTMLGTVLVLIFGEITPKILASANPEGIAVRIAGLHSYLGSLMRPFTATLESLANAMSRKIPKDNAKSEKLNEARLLGAVDYGETSGLIRNDEKEMIYGVIEAQELEVSEVMVPRTQVVALPEETSALDALKIMLKRGFSRIPLYLDSKDNTTGIITVKDLAHFVGANGDNWKEYLSTRTASSFARPPHFVPESKNVTDLLYEMRSAGQYMSVVVDEFDGVSGIVTLEDLIEEIVGEIHDEFDPGGSRAVPLGHGTWQVPGHMSLVDFEDAAGTSIDDDDCDTVAGLVMKYLERVPVAGDSFSLIEPKITFEVKEVRGPRIQKVNISVIEEEP
jgi:putative hemolysin